MSATVDDIRKSVDMLLAIWDALEHQAKGVANTIEEYKKDHPDAKPPQDLIDKGDKIAMIAAATRFGNLVAEKGCLPAMAIDVPVDKLPMIMGMIDLMSSMAADKTTPPKDPTN